MEHCREAGNAAGHPGSVTDLRSPAPLSQPGLRGRQRRARLQRCSGVLTTLCLACTEREATLLWGILPGDLILSTTSPPLPCNHGVTCCSHFSKGTQVSGFHTVFCLRQNTSFAKATDEKGSMPENQTK